MNLNTKTSCGEVSFYEAPSIQMLACSSEGVLCQSGEFSIKDWENDGDALDF